MAAAPPCRSASRVCLLQALVSYLLQALVYYSKDVPHVYLLQALVSVPFPQGCRAVTSAQASLTSAYVSIRQH